MRKKRRKRRWHTGEGWEKRAVKHARGRFGERLGIHLSEDGYWAIVRSIQSPETTPGRARLLYRQSRCISWHLVAVEGLKAIAVYDRGLRRVSTFLALSALSDIGLSVEALRQAQDEAVA